MPASKERAEAIAAQLSAVGLATRVEECDDCTAIEAEVPEPLSAQSWREVLEAVATADRFGLLATSSNDRTLWAVVHETVSATGDVGGPGHQR
ncbi:hypothetical protein ACIQVF_11290 [Streptomyces tendae]|uniref:hypothetical protein n=1 Tax=Streptomyces tendae TaxID=1932 RepID=UPI00381E0F1C